MRYALTLAASTLLALLTLSAPDVRTAEPERKLSEKEQAAWDEVIKILNKPDKLVLYSLDPMASSKEKDGERFRGWKVLGRTTLDKDESRKKVVAVAQSSKPGVGAKCFEPRHGIRGTAGDKAVDIVICFECRWVYVFLDKSDSNVRLNVDPAHQESLDAILKDAKVPLPTPAKK